MAGKMELLRRYVLFIISLFFVALAVNLTIVAALGITAISTLPFTFSVAFPRISLGSWIFILNLIFILLQIILLRKNFKKIQLIQIPLSLVFSFFIDLTHFFVQSVVPDTFFAQFAVMLLGSVVLAFGISLSVIANVVMNSGEALVKAIADVTAKNFGYVKVAFDISLLCISVISGWLLIGKIVGIGIGTVISACIVGFIVRFFLLRLSWIEKYLKGKT